MHAISWAPAPGFEDLYEVSTEGEVRRLVGRDGVSPGKRLSPQYNKGYPLVVLYRDAKRHKRDIHRLVALAFLGEPEPGMEVCHNDGNRGNPRLENLRWDTRSSNILDSVRHGTNHWANKQACPSGHPYDADNTVRRDGSRVCLTCKRAANARYKARKRGGEARGYRMASDHGERIHYSRGCRCSECKAANATYYRELAQRRAAAMKELARHVV